MTATAADGSRARPFEPFYAAVLANPARIEDSTRAGPGVLTGMALFNSMQDRYQKWIAEIAAVNANGGPRPGLSMPSGNLGAPGEEPAVVTSAPEPAPSAARPRRRRAPAYASA